MIHLEIEIHKILDGNKAATIVGKTLSATKNALNSSSHIVDGVNNFGDNLEEAIGENVGGIVGTMSGWIVGKATKTVGGIGGGIIAGTLKAVSSVIPDASSPKQPETDLCIASLVESYPLSKDKDALFELIQWLYGQTKSTKCIYGKSTIGAFKELHQRAYEMLSIIAKEDSDMLALAKPYAPKKKFGLF